MSLNPELWFESHKEFMPKEAVEQCEALKMQLRGWNLFSIIHQKLEQEMIAHVFSKIEAPNKVPLLTETLIQCAQHYILTLCTEIEVLIDCTKGMQLTADSIDTYIDSKNKLLAEEFEKEAYAGSKVLLHETIDIMQKYFLENKKELLDIEGNYWKYYRYCFQAQGMLWQIDAYKIVLELRKGVSPESLSHLTHDFEFLPVKYLVAMMEEVEAKKNL